MKIRKHKNNRTFRISFRTRPPARVETHVNSDGSTCKVAFGNSFGNSRVVIATGSDQPSVLRAFLFGRDVTNIRTTIFEAQAV